MYHDSYSPRQWLLNAFRHLDRDCEAVIASGWWPKGRIASTVDACALIIKAMGELTDERPH